MQLNGDMPKNDSHENEVQLPETAVSAEPTPETELVPAPLPSEASNAPVSVPATTDAPAKPEEPKVKSTFAGGAWLALIVGALLLIVLLVFILQNQQAVALSFFNLHISLPAGVGFLLAAIIGALIMALVGGVRMFQLRRQIKKRR